MLSRIIFVITGWTWPIWPSRDSRGNWYWTPWTKSKSCDRSSYEFLIVVWYYLWLFWHLFGLPILNQFVYINLQGDLGFQGRPGPPGPHGVGEPGLPVSFVGELLNVFVSAMFVSLVHLICREIPHSHFFSALSGWHIIYSGFVYRDLRDHKVFKGTKDP